MGCTKLSEPWYIVTIGRRVYVSKATQIVIHKYINNEYTDTGDIAKYSLHTVTVDCPLSSTTPIAFPCAHICTPQVEIHRL